ncbi:hypothetical protein [uncultured Chitinophaga sp.]|nr:hypothetical protein [uncultured Chitinophaga sp.]
MDEAIRMNIFDYIISDPVSTYSHFSEVRGENGPAQTMQGAFAKK